MEFGQPFRWIFYPVTGEQILFCNDRQLRSEVGGAATGTGYGTSNTFYAAYYRLDTTKTPNIKCGLKNDRFTANDTTIGNGALTYPIGLLTPDEAALAGMKAYTSNSTNYLYTNQVWWSFSPYRVNSYGHAYVWRLRVSGDLENYRPNVACEVRPGVNLKPNVKASGAGTVDKPYIVKDL